MTIYTFDQAAAAGPHWYEQAARGTDPAAFERAVGWMRAQKFRADTRTGTTRRGGEVVARFVGYDWAAEYDAHPDRVFHDFFMGHLMNAYTHARAQVPA